MLRPRSLLALASVLLSILTGCSDEDTAAAAVPEVYVAAVVQRDVPIYMEIVGQTLGSQDVDIRARVDNNLTVVIK